MSSSGLILALLSMLGYGIGNGLVKVPASKFSHQKVIFYREIFACGVLLFALFFFLKSSHFDLLWIFLAYLLSIVGYFGLSFFYKALNYGNVGIISPVANSSTLITILLALAFLNERLNIYQLIATLLILIGIVLVSINFKLFKNSHIFSKESGVPYALITCLIWGVFFFFLKFIVDHLGPILATLVIELGTFSSCLVDIKAKKIEYLPIKTKDLVTIAAVAIISTFAAIFFNIGIQHNSVSLMSAISFSSPLVAVLFGKFVYKEKLKPTQFAAIALLLIGITALSYF